MSLFLGDSVFSLEGGLIVLLKRNLGYVDSFVLGMLDCKNCSVEII